MDGTDKARNSADNTKDRTELERLEGIIRVSLPAFRRAWNALEEIRNRGLYWQVCEHWEDYQARWLPLEKTGQARPALRIYRGD